MKLTGKRACVLWISLLLLHGCANEPVARDPFGRPYVKENMVEPIPLSDCQPKQGFDEPPRLVSGTRPLFPVNELLSGHAGGARIDFEVTTEGKARIVSREGDKPWFKTHAAIAMRDWSLTPAQKNGVAVATICSMLFDYRYSPKQGTGSEPNKGDAANESPAPVAPEDAEGFAKRGQAAMKRGDFERALEDLDRACALSPQTARYFLDRAKAHDALNQQAKALADAEEALRLDPTLHAARLLRAWWRRDAGGDDSAALADLRTLDAALPPSSDLRSSMAGLYTQMNLVPDALRQWDLWLSAHPHSAARGRVLNGRCWLRTRLKLDLPQALEDCKQAVALDGSNANIRDSLGWTYLRLGDLARAVEAFDGGIKLYGKLALSYYGRGKAFRLLGNAEQAQRDLRVARILDPQIDDKVKSEGFEPEPLPSGKAVD